jgi:iron(III) transport system permease protein
MTNDPAPRTNERLAWARWRVGVAVGVLLVIGVPLAMPFAGLAGDPAAWSAWEDVERLAELAANTLRLVAGTLAVAMPLGVASAVLLYRTDLPGRRVFRFLVLLTLFVPLPLFTSAWQAALGPGGLTPLGAWSAPAAGDPDVSPTGGLWKPWATGVWAATWVHAAAALPWVIVLVGQGLCWVETELEEDALTVASGLRVLWRVTLPRCGAAMLAAGLWVAVQTAGEISVTDAMQVHTFAEEVYTQLVTAGPDAIARSVAVAVPSVVATWLLVAWAVRHFESRVLPLWSFSPTPLLFRLGRWRWPLLVLTLLAAGVLVGVPVASLVWKAGLSGRPEAWSAATAWLHVRRVFRLNGRLLAESLAVAAAAGVLLAGLALVVCWLGTRCLWLVAGAFTLASVAWALPGPLVGLGLQATIHRVLDLLGSRTQGPGVVAVALWYGPSLLPVLWAYLLRFFPFALALLWPVVRLVPVELHEAARVDGAAPRHDLRHVVWPLARVTWVNAALALAVLSLGEVSASKLVATPRGETFTHEIFVQMHYGVANDLAARCLLLLAVVLAGMLAVTGMGVVLRLRHRRHADS